MEFKKIVVALVVASCLTEDALGQSFEADIKDFRIPAGLVLDTEQGLASRDTAVTQWLEDAAAGFLATKGSKLHGRCILLQLTASLGKADAAPFRRVTPKTYAVRPVTDVRALAGNNVADFCGDLKAVALVDGRARVRRSPQCTCVFVCQGGVCFCQFRC